MSLPDAFYNKVKPSDFLNPARDHQLDLSREFTFGRADLFDNLVEFLAETVVSSSPPEGMQEQVLNRSRQLLSRCRKVDQPVRDVMKFITQRSGGIVNHGEVNEIYQLVGETMVAFSGTDGAEDDPAKLQALGKYTLAQLALLYLVSVRSSLLKKQEGESALSESVMVNLNLYSRAIAILEAKAAGVYSHVGQSEANITLKDQAIARKGMENLLQSSLFRTT